MKAKRKKLGGKKLEKKVPLNVTVKGISTNYPGK